MKRKIETSLRRAMDQLPQPDYWTVAEAPVQKMEVHDYVTRQDVSVRPVRRRALPLALAACALAVFCHACTLADDVIRPALAVVRATPVASFIILALVWLSASNVPVLAGVLMVVPVVFANVREGIDAVDPLLLDMARLFGWGRWRTWRHVVIPSVAPTFCAACEACVGLCFKATIAAEVIGVPKNAIGTQLYHAKIYLETDTLLAWTATVIALSMALERLLRAAFERGRRRGNRA